jgi:RNA polymerase sigma-70 factor (ECF subfamily)
VGSDIQTCSDGELVRQCQDGSLTAFEELVYRYEDRIYGFVSKACGNAADAREVTQDTFVRAFQAIAQFDCRRTFGPWLFTIARRKCIDRFRGAESGVRNAERGVGNWGWWPVPEQVDDDDPAEVLAREEERQSLWETARRRLSELQFEVIWLRYVDGMSVADIADVLRKTQTHVKVLLFRARQVLARELKAGQGTASSAAHGSSWIALAGEAQPFVLASRQSSGKGKCEVGYSGTVLSAISSTVGRRSV